MKMLNWAKQFNIFCFLDNCGYQTPEPAYECLLGAGTKHVIKGNDPLSLKHLLSGRQWYFGHLAYELKNPLHGFSSVIPNTFGFPLFYFFVPQVVAFVRENVLTILSDDPDAVYALISAQEVCPEKTGYNISIRQELTREEYLSIIQKLKAHILKGDCYEINFCQEFFAENVKADPVALFQMLTQISPNPFSALYRNNDDYLVCASPERFLKKEGSRILSQPIKGTIKRNLADSKKDEELLNQLKQSSKDRSENVMIVDLVRNDLTKICEDGSVQVDELFGIYSYPQVHQMISTVSGQLREDISFDQLMEACFPMGSMTGAPKHRVMELIDQYENSSRGLFSGTVGYIDPNGNMDLNVVIRSIIYNATTGYLSFKVGSGITFYSDPQSEWDECLLKAEAIKKVLTGGSALDRSG